MAYRSDTDKGSKPKWRPDSSAAFIVLSGLASWACIAAAIWLA